jgi:hypothetical protein
MTHRPSAMVMIPLVTAGLLLATVRPSAALLCRKPNGTVVVRSGCGGKLVAVTAADIGEVGVGPKGDKGDQGPTGPPGASIAPESPEIVSAYVETDQFEPGTPIYTVPPGKSFILTDVDANIAPTSIVVFSDSSGIRLLVVSSSNDYRAFATYVSGVPFASGETITAKALEGRITIMGRLVPEAP